MFILNHFRITVFLKYLKTPTDTTKVMATFWVRDFSEELAVLKSMSTQKNKKLPWWKPTLRSEFLSLVSDMVIFSCFSLQIIWMTAKFSLFTYFYLLFLAVLGLGCCGGFSPAVVSRSLLSRCHMWASHWGGFSCCGARALGVWASVAAAPRLESKGWIIVAHGLSCPTECVLIL